MKYVYILVFIIITPIAYAQDPGANQIIVTNGRVASENYLDVLKTFLSKGYKIDRKDDLFYTALFKPITYHYSIKNRKNKQYLIVSLSFRGDSTIISAKNKKSGVRKSETIYDPNRPETVEAFNILVEVAEKLGGEISFNQIPGYVRHKPKYVDDLYGN